MLKLHNKLLLLAYFACLTAAGAATSTLEQNRIVGGEETIISSFPWQVSVQHSAIHICGGSIYSETIIITTANCLENANVKLLKVRAGATYYNKGGSLIQVAALKLHDGYNDKTMVNNIAILRLSTPLQYGFGIKPIALAATNPEDGATAVVSGWGVREYGSNEMSTTLQYADLQIISYKECASSKYGYGYLITKDMLCAAANGKDACKFDAGGPLVSGGLLVGIVSWGFGCAYNDFPGVYTSIAEERNWLLQAVKEI